MLLLPNSGACTRVAGMPRLLMSISCRYPYLGCSQTPGCSTRTPALTADVSRGGMLKPWTSNSCVCTTFINGHTGVSQCKRLECQFKRHALALASRIHCTCTASSGGISAWM